MRSLTYMTILFATIFVCFLFSFHPKLRFNRYFLPFIKASVLVAVPFIIWDIFFTEVKVWWFDFNYTLGIDIFGLPLEECLFFICIPFSCMFTYYCFSKFFRFENFSKWNAFVSSFLILLMALSTVCFYDRMYTVLTSVVLLATVIYLQFIAKQDWISKAVFIYIILLFGFLPVNGILTGTGIDSPIVNYNPNEFLGIRIFTIPIEDWFYGLAQFLLVLYFFKLFSKSKQNIRTNIDEVLSND